jgi:hypothetical protein
LTISALLLRIATFSKSAMSADGRTVVFAVWEDDIQRVGGRVICEPIRGLRKRHSRQLSQRDFHDVSGAGYLLVEQNAIVHADSRSSRKVG